MRVLMILPIATMMLAAAGAPPTKQTKPAPAAAAVQARGIPAGAVQTGPQSYRYTDAAGKTWLYFKTPFGIMSAEERPEPADAEERAMEAVTARADGDTIRFERPTPFGMFHWQKKKSELNEFEQRVWERENSAAGPAQD